ncbi:DUF2523 family protein [Dyella sp.]|uniref:DUF2523 family protein n=1 Tax=Dyella sp. TaxID=1869338 RepID=UPI00284F602E|nr:DUF2523 family protein [Dyella sp.]MDR3445149.1 DUF2523 family protein [Dyella sp.]
MARLIAWLGVLLETKLGTFVVNALLTLGVSFTSYKFGVAPLTNFITQQIGQLPGQVANVIGWLGGGIAMSMILSAIAAKYATNGISAVLTKKGATGAN